MKRRISITEIPFAEKGMSDPFSALAYAKSPYTKAPAIVAPVSAWLYGVNLVGSGDRGDTLGVVTHVATVTGAFDVTKIGVFTATDALTFIGTGSHSWSRAEAQLVPAIPVLITDATIPSASGTLSYLNGGFSADFTALASWVRSFRPTSLWSWFPTAARSPTPAMPNTVSICRIRSGSNRPPA